MNLFLKELMILIIGNLLISAVICDETIELSCSSNDDCMSFEDKFIASYCSNDSCACLDRKTGKSLNCIPTVSSVSNDQIKEQPCSAPNTESKNGRCRTSKVHLGKSCEASEQCERNDWNSECYKGICACKEHFLELDKICRSLIKIEKCTKNDQCSENAECLKEKCVCNKEFISAANFTTCLPFSSYNEECSEDLQCAMTLGFGSVCENSVCKCKSNYSALLKDGKHACLRKILVGDPCNENADCMDDDLKMYCHNNKCKCMIGFETYSEDVCFKNDVRSLPQSSAASSIRVFKMLSFVLVFVVFLAMY